MMMRGYKTYKTYYNVPLIKNGYNTYNINGNTKLGKIIESGKKKISKLYCMV